MPFKDWTQSLLSSAHVINSKLINVDLYITSIFGRHVGITNIQNAFQKTGLGNADLWRRYLRYFWPPWNEIWGFWLWFIFVEAKSWISQLSLYWCWLCEINAAMVYDFKLSLCYYFIVLRYYLILPCHQLLISAVFSLLSKNESRLIISPVCLSPTNNLWTASYIFMKFGTDVMPFKETSMQ
jgi:hypothetical protein